MRQFIRHCFKSLADPILNWQYSRYARVDRTCRFMGLTILVKSGVFHPVFFFSTKALAKYLSTLSLKGKKVLELGCGTGAISVWAAKNGALATASDIHPIAVNNAQENAHLNGVKIQSVVSDLFENLNDEMIDLIVINPPYYPQKPTNLAENAWYCGEEFEYFKGLFSQLAPRPNSEEVFMVLSEDCQVNKIKEIAHKNQLELRLVHTEKSILEWSYIFKAERKPL